MQTRPLRSWTLGRVQSSLSTNLVREAINSYSCHVRTLVLILILSIDLDFQLASSLGPFIMTNAAEIIRYTSAGWTSAGIASFASMLTDVFYPCLEGMLQCESPVIRLTDFEPQYTQEFSMRQILALAIPKHCWLSLSLRRTQPCKPRRSPSCVHVSMTIYLIIDIGGTRQLISTPMKDVPVSHTNCCRPGKVTSQVAIKVMFN